MNVSDVQSDIWFFQVVALTYREKAHEARVKGDMAEFHLRMLRAIFYMAVLREKLEGTV